METCCLHQVAKGKMVTAWWRWWRERLLRTKTFRIQTKQNPWCGLGARMDLEIIILNEMSEKERQILYDITYMWNLKYETSEVLSMKQCEFTHIENRFVWGFLFFFVFLGPHPWHMQIPRLGGLFGAVERTDLWFSREKGGWGSGWTGSLGLTDANYWVDKQQGSTYSTGNYIQYLEINHNGKDYEKEYIYIYIYIYIYAYDWITLLYRRN